MTKPHTQEYIAAEFTKKGCELLGTYKSKDIPVKFRCKCGEISTIRYGNLKNEQYCMDCGGKRKHTTEEIKKIVENRNCELLSEYKNAHSKIIIKCHCGKIYETVWSNFREGRSCKECGFKKYTGENHPRWQTDREMVKFRNNLSKRLNSLVRCVYDKTGDKKTSKSESILGYSRKDLLEHITSHSNWNDLKDKKFDIDHIFPIKAFVDYGITEPAIISCLDNLRPLCYVKNRTKNAKYIKEEFENWLVLKNIKFNNLLVT